MRRKVLVLFVIALVCGGCSFSTTSTLIPTRTSTQITVSVSPTALTAVRTMTPSKTATITQTPLPTITLRPTATPWPKSLLGTDCWSIQESFPNGNLPSYRLVLVPDNPKSLTYLMDFQERKNFPFPEEGEKLINVRVSPDGKWLAGKEIEARELYVIDSVGKTFTKVPYQAGWGTVSQWINDSTILIQEDDNYPLNTLFAVNPFTRTVSELPHLFPDIDIIRVHPWDYSGLTIYDPKLQLVVYPELSSDGNVIVLWDLSKNAPVFRLKDPRLNPNPIPKWSQDGEKFVFTGLHDHPLTLIYKDGSTKHSEIKLQDKYSSIIDLTSWSPDGKKLAFWLKPKNGTNDLHLMIWDTLADNIVDTCIPSDNIPEYIGYPNLPVWSLDGKYLAVKSVRPGDQNKNQIDEWNVLLVDLDRKLAGKIAENAIPLGWTTR